MENYALFITDAQSAADAQQVAQAITEAGGRIGVIIDRVLLGWVDADKAKLLVGENKIREIYTSSGSTSKSGSSSFSSAAAGLSESEEAAAAFFDLVASGRYKREKAAIRSAGAMIGRTMLPDARNPGRVAFADLMNNLKANGVRTEQLQKNGITIQKAPSGAAALAPGNSDYMVGTVGFNVIFVESDGGVDGNLYTWTAADRTTIQDEIIAGLSWWSNTASVSDTYNTPLTFVPAFFYDSRTTTRYEPILHRSSDDSLWINEIMGKFGYTSGDKFARTTAFNTARRVAANTNWSVTSFVGYNPSPASSTFTDGYFAYAYIRGPYSQLLFNNDGWGGGQLRYLNAHESGHLFGAQDEYYQAGYGGCTSCGASTNGVLNGNCQFCNANAIQCMMRNNYYGLCGYTPGQIGWRSLSVCPGTS
jgi:hypothetical protein